MLKGVVEAVDTAEAAVAEEVTEEATWVEEVEEVAEDTKFEPASSISAFFALFQTVSILKSMNKLFFSNSNMVEVEIL